MDNRFARRSAGAGDFWEGEDMEELIKRLERVIATGAPDKDGQHPISAETVLEVVKELSALGTNLASLGTDCISRQQAIDALGELATFTQDWSCHTWMYTDDVYGAIEQLPPIQPDNCSEFPNNSDTISRQAAIDRILATGYADQIKDNLLLILRLLPPAQPEIIRCKDCKHNPKYEWFGCPMSHLSEKQRPETAWCWKAERRTDERSD